MQRPKYSTPACLPGGRRIDAWYAQLNGVEVQFADEVAFRNINTREELDVNSGNQSIRSP